MEGSLILLSGGLDSSTLLLSVEDKNKHALIFKYGQPHEVEVEYAIKLCEEHGIEYTVHEFSLPSSGLLDSNSSTPVIQGRNATMISIGAAYAASLDRWGCLPGLANLYIAANKDDQSLFPDCTPEFLDAMQAALVAGYGINLQYPFIKKTKSEILELAWSLGLKTSDTWSCYDPVRKLFTDEVKECGLCLPCQQIREAYNTLKEKHND